ncbi:polyphosphate polymerase domain-containing protein [Ruminococcaceae bacterium OttesenSCG-928-D13]|nr:polyphosphate polymerase domain-containing protein [Ruminococcaceae bacterium OttesenSCG-928-D13]
MGNEHDQFRHEFKYVCDVSQIAILRNRASALMSMDTNVNPGGSYNIRSLYFDDMYDSCYHDNLNGTDNREKFRIRIYDHSSAFIRLELKRKIRGKTQKLSCSLDEHQCRDLMGGRIPGGKKPYLLQRLSAEMAMRRMRPKIIVAYDRIPYIYSGSTIRVTFDMNISSSMETGQFLDDQLALRPFMPIGKHLMEVKYDEYFPDYIYSSLCLAQLRQETFSKYFLSRIYSGGDTHGF